MRQTTMCPYLSSLSLILDTQALAKLHQTSASKLRGAQKCTRWLRTSSKCLWDFGVLFQLQIHIIVVKAMENTTLLRIQSRGPVATSLSTFSHDPHIRTPCQRDTELDQPFGYSPYAESEPERLDRVTLESKGRSLNFGGQQTRKVVTCQISSMYIRPAVGRYRRCDDFAPIQHVTDAIHHRA